MLIPEKEFLKRYKDANLDLNIIHKAMLTITKDMETINKSYDNGHILVLALDPETSNLYYSLKTPVQIDLMTSTYNADGFKILNMLSH
jgi:hypothetical protein